MYKSLLVLFIMSLFLTGTSQEHTGAFTFVENKGQWPDQVSFKSDLRSGYLYLEDQGLHFNLYDPATVNKYIEGHYNKELRKELDELKWHSYKVNFVEGNFDSKKTGASPTDHYYNFYLGADQSKWASKAYGYHNVEYKELYKGIDFKMYSQLFNLKYDFIVAPNANPDQIKLEYEGADKIALIKGKLHIYTSVNHIIEAAPKVYQVVAGKQVIIPSRYKLEGNIISYEILEDYDQTKELIIDPTLIFSTYSGSFSNNFGYSATFDSKGFLYSGSSAFGNAYPTILGSYNTSFAGGIVDIAISKFDTTGTFLIYSTYLGGNSDELPHSLIVNSVDELFIFGTTSSSNYPTTTNCFDNSYNGGTPVNLQNGLGVNYTNGSDIVVSRLSADGTSLQASTYIGGSANDGLNSTNINSALNVLRYNYADEVRGEIDIDKNNNIYIATCTQSIDFPTTTGAFQTAYGGGALDGCVMKLDNNLQNMIWSSYIGGEKHDAVYALALDDNNDIYVTGGTESDSLLTTSIALDTTFQGGRSDGFVTHIQADGSSIINSTYIGSNTYDQSYFVELDKPGNVYLLGQTEVTDSTFVKNVTWSNFGSGQFVAKLSPELDTLLYSTVFGSGNGINISPTAFLVDLCNKMYLAGWGGTVNNLSSLNNNAGYTNGMPISSDAYQSTTDGSDFYIMVLEDDASGVVYGSYFGGSSATEHVDGGTSRFDRKGKVYQAMCAGCGGYSDMPIEPANAHSPTNNNNCNLGVFKMDFDLPVVVADFDAPPLGCAPFNVNFTNTSLSQANTSFIWHFGDGATGLVENPSHTYTSPGTYEITLIINDPATCNFGDTISKEIIVLGDTAYALQNISICPGDIEQIGVTPQADPSITYTWTPATDISNDSISNPFANPVTTTNYQLLISNGVCTDTVAQTVIVNTPIINVNNDTTLCDNSQVVTLTANSMGTSTNYQWSSSNQFLDTINTPITNNSITVSPIQTTTYFVEVNNNGCTIYDSVTVDIATGQLALSTFEVICEGDSTLITVTNLSASETFTFDWSPDSEILSGDGSDCIWVNPTTAQMFYLNAVSSIGCVIVDSVLIGVDNLPSLTINVTASPDTIYAGNTSQLNVLPNGYSYVWTPSNSLNDNTLQSPVATPETTTTYTVAISGSGGSNCTKEGEITVVVKEVVCGQPDVFVPNGFTPNGDGKNDVLRVRGNNIEFTLFRVYDRWGELVFETNDQTIGWDGTFKGKDCDPAVFVYYLDGVCVDGEEFLMKGNVSLIR